MTDRPIIFSGPMVRALLAGRKTMTRRLAWRTVPVNMSDTSDAPLKFVRTNWQNVQPGDRLWVREACADEHPLAVQAGRFSQEGRAGIPGPPPVACRTIYRADGGEPLQVWRRDIYPYFSLYGPQDELAAKYPTVSSNYVRHGKGIYWTPSIHMPRWASRLTLTVTATRIERLQDISEVDAIVEGIEPAKNWVGEPYWVDYESDRHADGTYVKGHRSPVDSFASLWRSLHGEASWHDNPEVVAISFAVHKANIDQMKEAA